MDGAVDLASVGVAAYAHVQGSERYLWRILHVVRQKNSAGAGAKGRLGSDKVAQLIEKSLLFKEVQKGAGLASGNHNGINGIQLLRLAHQEHLDAQPLQHGPVGVVVALDGQDPDFWFGGHEGELGNLIW